jgi:uncharacterized membrane protein
LCPHAREFNPPEEPWCGDAPRNEKLPLTMLMPLAVTGKQFVDLFLPAVSVASAAITTVSGLYALFCLATVDRDRDDFADVMTTYVGMGLGIGMLFGLLSGAIVFFLTL